MLAFDEARFGLINWHRRRYCPMGFRPPYVVKRSDLFNWRQKLSGLQPLSFRDAGRDRS